MTTNQPADMATLSVDDFVTRTQLAFDTMAKYGIHGTLAEWLGPCMQAYTSQAKELAAARERIKKMEDVLREMIAAFVDDTDDSALAVATRALLEVAESGGESGGSEVGE